MDWRCWNIQSPSTNPLAKMHARRILLLVLIALMLADSGCAYLKPDPDFVLKREEEAWARRQYIKEHPGMELFYEVVSGFGTLVK